jgi:long-chain acyl-CoA synthetase
MPTVGEILSRKTDAELERLAVVCKRTNSRCTYGELNARVNKLANGLIQRGLGRGDRLGLLLPNGIQFIESFFASAKVGSALVALDSRLVGRELAYILNDAEAEALIVGPEHFEIVQSIRSQLDAVKWIVCVGDAIAGELSYEELIAAHPATEPDRGVEETDLATLYYTSGTTGIPKGIMTTHRNLWAAMINTEVALPVTSEDITLHTSPLSHIAAVWPLLTHCHTGGGNVIVERFDAKLVLEAIEREKVTTWNSVPTMIQRVLEYPDVQKYDLSSLNWVGYGASPMPVEVLKRAIATCGNRFAQVYGSTEAYIVTLLPKEDHVVEGPEEKVKRLASCGRPIGDCEVRIVGDDGRAADRGEVGEIVVRGDSVFSGYWRQPEETTKAVKQGWFSTGDLASMDEEGYVFITGRKKDLIISGGENISPREVEEVIYRHAAVSEVAVIGVPDEKWGEAVIAVVVLREGNTASSEEIISFCKDDLARFKAPKVVDFVDSLPKTPTGKLLRRALKERYAGGA